MADFGLSRIIHHDGGGGIVQNRTVCGTPLFMAPEILQRKPYDSFLVDVWALGITIYIMVTMEVPFDFSDMNKAINDMVTKNWTWPEDKMKGKPSEDMKAITAAMLDPDPTKRMPLIEVTNNAWIATEFKRAQALANKK